MGQVFSSHFAVLRKILLKKKFILKINSCNSRKRYNTCSNLKIKILEQRFCLPSSVFLHSSGKSGHISHLCFTVFIVNFANVNVCSVWRPS